MTHLAMALYPFVAALLFARFRLTYAIPASVLVGLLLLPSRFAIEIPLLPNLNRFSWPIIVTSLLAVWCGSRSKRARDTAPSPTEGELRIHDGWLPTVALMPFIIVLVFVVPFGNWLSNADSVVRLDTVLPGLTLFDAFSRLQAGLLSLAMILVGWKYMGTEAAHRNLLLTVAAAGLLYTLPTILEIRLSPQIHVWVYGYFQHSWLQHIRGDGFRPVVFMPHALELSTFLTLSALSVIGYMRAINGDRRVLFFLAAAWIVAVVFLSKSLGMVLIACLAVPAMLFLSSRAMLLVAAVIAVFVFTYPLQRSLGFSPFNQLVTVAESYAPDRARSLRFRLENEAALVEEVNRKPVFGWGGWGRNTVGDDRTGRSDSVLDGYWLITFSKEGWAGMIKDFGPMVFPIFLLAVRRRTAGVATASLCFVLAANLVDMIPNSSATILTLLISGALIGRLEWLRKEDELEGRTGQSVPPSSSLEHQVRESRPSGRAGQNAQAGIGLSSSPRDAKNQENERSRYTRFHKVAHMRQRGGR